MFISQRNLDLEFYLDAKDGAQVSNVVPLIDNNFLSVHQETHFRMRFLSFALLSSLAFAALAEEEGETTAFSKVRIESCAG